MELDEEEQALGGDEEEQEEENQEEAKEGDPHISIHALKGMAEPRTMRIQANIGKLKVTILVDNGSSLNFINSKVTESLGLPITLIIPFEFKVENEKK